MAMLNSLVDTLQTSLRCHAIKTADYYFGHAALMLDRLYGENYSKGHPEIVLQAANLYTLSEQNAAALYAAIMPAGDRS